MCTLAIYFRVFPGHPLVVAANRDEFLARPTLEPAPFGEGVFCGVDRQAGGTWLGINRAGVVAALLNRRTVEPPDPTARSRGLLCLDALGHAEAASARSALADENVTSYNPFNLLVADADHAWVATNHDGRLSIGDLDPGLHLLTNLDLDDPTCPRISRSWRLFADLLPPGNPEPDSPRFVEELRRILSTHETPLDPRGELDGNSLCLHVGEYGTCSSSLIFRDGRGGWVFWHSPEAPCRSDYVSLPLPAGFRAEPAITSS